MENKFKGKALFLDRDDINTDEIIPARYLTEIDKTALKPHLLEDLKLKNFDSHKDIKGKKIVVSRQNFGCGSSREHAPWSFEVNGINVIIAQSFARIFKQNMFNCGMLAIELSEENINILFNEFNTDNTIIDVDIENSEIIVNSNNKTQKMIFLLSPFHKALIQSGGWVEFADQHY